MSTSSLLTLYDGLNNRKCIPVWENAARNNSTFLLTRNQPFYTRKSEVWHATREVTNSLVILPDCLTFQNPCIATTSNEHESAPHIAGTAISDMTFGRCVYETRGFGNTRIVQLKLLGRMSLSLKRKGLQRSTANPRLRRVHLRLPPHLLHCHGVTKSPNAEDLAFSLYVHFQDGMKFWIYLRLQFLCCSN